MSPTSIVASEEASSQNMSENLREVVHPIYVCYVIGMLTNQNFVQANLRFSNAS